MSALVITCPDCSTRYKAAVSSIGHDGRSVRCVKCGSTWFVPAPDAIDTLLADPDALALSDNLVEQTQPPAAAEAESSPNLDSAPKMPPIAQVALAPGSQVGVGADVMMRNHVDHEKIVRRQRTIRFIWAVPIILVLLATIIAYFNRQNIVNRIPQMASVYQMLGVEVRAGGLEIDPPEARTILVDGQPVIRIESVVRNLTGQTKAVPLIELTLHDVDGQGLVQWYVESDPVRIEAHGRLVFTTEIADPPTGAVGLRYKFADDMELAAATGL